MRARNVLLASMSRTSILPSVLCVLHFLMWTRVLITTAIAYAIPDALARTAGRVNRALRASSRRHTVVWPALSAT